MRRVKAEATGHSGRFFTQGETQKLRANHQHSFTGGKMKSKYGN